MNVHLAPRQSSLRNRLALLFLVSALVLVLSPHVVRALSSVEADAGQTVTDMTEIELASSPSLLARLDGLGISSNAAESAGYLHADVTQEQLATLDKYGVSYVKGQSFVLIQGQGISGEASVTGSNGSNVNIVGNDTVYSHATVSGAPLGKTVIRADVGVVLNYPQMCNIYIMVFHPSNTMWFHAWNGNQHACTANLNQQWTGIHDFDFADINGQWHLSVQETGGLSQGFIDSWFIKLYYQVDSTPTPTRTATPSIRRQFLPLIVSEL